MEKQNSRRKNQLLKLEMILGGTELWFSQMRVGLWHGVRSWVYKRRIEGSETSGQLFVSH
jgi:hypothetical protein